MDTKVFKRLIKEAVKEAMQEELKELLFEAVRAPKAVVKESYNTSMQTLAHSSVVPSASARDKYRELLGNMMEARNGNISMNSTDALGFGSQVGYRPPSTVNTTAEGSALPAGEVNLNQIMGLINKK